MCRSFVLNTCVNKMHNEAAIKSKELRMYAYLPDIRVCIVAELTADTTVEHMSCLTGPRQSQVLHAVPLVFVSGACLHRVCAAALRDGLLHARGQGLQH